MRLSAWLNWTDNTRKRPNQKKFTFVRNKYKIFGNWLYLWLFISDCLLCNARSAKWATALIYSTCISTRTPRWKYYAYKRQTTKNPIPARNNPTIYAIPTVFSAIPIYSHNIFALPWPNSNILATSPTHSSTRACRSYRKVSALPQNTKQ